MSPAHWLPRGRRLAGPEFRRRHELVCGLLGLHVPGVLLVALLAGHDLLPGLGAAALPAALLALAASPVERGAQAAAAVAGLLATSALLVVLTSASGELHVHAFLGMAAAALYQQWRVYGVALAALALHQVLVLSLGAEAAAGHLGGAAGWAALHAGFAVVGSAVLLQLWRSDELVREQAETLAEQLHDGHDGVRARLAEADRIRADLIATVSHEFRTPLTGIRGSALTLLKRGERLGPAARAQLLHAVVEQEARLSRLLENMLTAATATAPDPGADCEVAGVAAEVVSLACRPGGPISLIVDPGTRARIDPAALHQVLANLVDNAQQHGARRSVPLLTAGQDGDEVWIRVSNEGAALDPGEVGRLLEPFTQVAMGPTREREGMGNGLYVVRRLVEVHSGRVAVHSTAGWVTVEVRLPAAAPGCGPGAAGRQTPAPTAVPIP